MPTPNEFPPRVLSDEEIEMYLKSDHIEVNRLILYSLNRIAAVLVPHAQREEEMLQRMNDLGGFEQIKLRAEFVNSQIKKNNDRAEMMKKVTNSSIVWVFIAFMIFMGKAAWHATIEAMRGAIK